MLFLIILYGILQIPMELVLLFIYFVLLTSMLLHQVGLRLVMFHFDISSLLKIFSTFWGVHAYILKNSVLQRFLPIYPEAHTPYKGA